MAKQKDKAPVQTFIPLSVLNEYKRMYPAYSHGIQAAVLGWIELSHATIKEISNKLTREELLLCANSLELREYDVYSFVDFEYFKKSLELYLRLENETHLDIESLLGKIHSFTAAQRVFFADWCFQYNKRLDARDQLLSLLLNTAP